MSSPRRTRSSVAALATLGFAALALAVPAPALAADASWYVDQANGTDTAGCGTAAGPDACATIGAAVALAEDTDTISIAPGEYIESLVIDKSLTLQGVAGATSVKGDGLDGSRAAISAELADGATTAPTVAIQGLEVTGRFAPGILVDGADATLTEGTVVGSSDSREQRGGMRVFPGSATIIDSVFRDNGNALLVGYSVPQDDQGSAELVIEGSRFQDNQNGAIVEYHDDASVTIDDTLIENTGSGTGVSSDNVSISHSTIRNNGRGGIETSGNVTITDSTIADNFGVGVMLYDNGHLDMTRTTISGTKPYDEIMGTSQLLGAGIFGNLNSAAVIESSTIWGNTGQGVLSAGTSIDIRNSTIGGTAPSVDAEGGGFPTPSAAVAVLNELVPPEVEIEMALSLAGSIVSGSADVPACVGEITDAGYNLATDDSCAFGDTSLNNTDPLLGALADNGGPTQTLMPAFGPAVDAVPVGAVGRDGLSADQRGDGYGRLIGPRGDIGAVEVAQEPVVISPDALPDGKVGEEYSVTLSATGGVGEPYDWSLVAPTLPEGLTLSADGVISGIPTEDGTFSITINVDDGAATKDYTVVVAAADPVVPDPDPPVVPDPPVDPGNDPENGGVDDAGSLPATGGDASAALMLASLLLLLGGSVFAGAHGLRRIRSARS